MRVGYGLLAVAVPFLGCMAKRDPIVGIWQGKSTFNGAQITQTATYNPDGTFQTDAIAAKPGLPMRLHIRDTGTWKKVGENQYDERITDTSWTPEGVSAAGAAKVAARFKARKASIIASANKDSMTNVKWLGRDSFSATSGGITTTFARSQGP